MRWCIPLCTAAVMAAAMFVASSASAVVVSPLGYNVVGSHYDEVDAGDGQYVRINSNQATLIDDVNAAGLTPVIILPRPLGTDDGHVAADPSETATQYATRIANNYLNHETSDDVDVVWEIMNEVNHNYVDGDWPSPLAATGLAGKDYADYVHSAVNAINGHQFADDDAILFGSMVNGVTDADDVGMDTEEYQNALGNAVDDISLTELKGAVHLYAGAANMSTSSEFTTWLQDTMADDKIDYEEADGDDRPVWVTEYGLKDSYRTSFQTADTPCGNKPSWLVDGYEAIDTRTNHPTLIWQFVRNQTALYPDVPSDWPSSWGSGGTYDTLAPVDTWNCGYNQLASAAP